MPRPKTEVSANQVRGILAKYAADRDPKPMGLLEIAESFEPSLTVAVVRRVLVENGVEIRGRGRPCLAEA
jgi:hypothetical protein